MLIAYKNTLIIFLFILLIVFCILYFTKTCSTDCSKCVPNQWETVPNLFIDPDSDGVLQYNMTAKSVQDLQGYILSRKYDAGSFVTGSGGGTTAYLCKNPNCNFIKTDNPSARTYKYLGEKCKLDN